MNRALAAPALANNCCGTRVELRKNFVPVDVPIPVPHVRVVEKARIVRIPHKVFVDRPYPVPSKPIVITRPVPVAVPKPVILTHDRIVAVPQAVDKPIVVDRPVDVPRPVAVPQPHPVPVPRPVCVNTCATGCTTGCNTCF